MSILKQKKMINTKWMPNKVSSIAQSGWNWQMYKIAQLAQWHMYRKISTFLLFYEYSSVSILNSVCSLA